MKSIEFKASFSTNYTDILDKIVFSDMCSYITSTDFNCLNEINGFTKHVIKLNNSIGISYYIN